MDYFNFKNKIDSLINIDEDKKLYICIYYKNNYNDELKKFIQSTKNHYEIFSNDLSNENFYYNYDKNWHHLKTAFIWDTMIPNIIKYLNIDQFDKNNFKLIQNKISNDIDLSYHQHIKQTFFEFKNIDTNFIISGSSNNSILRINSNNDRQKCREINGISKYHDLYRGYHTNSLVKNLSNKFNRKLLIYGDSMTIPLIPILAYFLMKYWYQIIEARKILIN